MIRIITPTPTRGDAPSHSPPDVRYAPGLGLARALGWFSIGLGLAELVLPRQMAELTGVHKPDLLRVYGVREIACGLGCLGSARPAGWLWGRVAGDALDLATLGAALVAGNGQRGRALAATAAVAGVTALDLLCAGQLSAAAALEG
jgi:hypothetical protein